MAKKKYYAVKRGKTPGIYLTWEDCRSQISGFSGAVYKGFETLEEAGAFLQQAGGGEAQAESAFRQQEVPQECSGVLAAGKGEAVAYVDGSYNAATKEYGCGVVFLADGEEVQIAQKGENRDLASMRNVAGEILGAELAMKKAVEMGIRKLSIYHDYQGISSWCQGDWKANKEGTKAYKAYFDSIRDEIEICFVKVKGHSGDKYNDKADELAKSAIF